MKQIYNEGRVVGFSAWELFIRQQLSDDPDADLPTEREWLSSSIGSGSSMLLKVAAGTTAGYHDYQLPSNSNLCACAHVKGCVFVGDGIFDEIGWATKITDYGQLILNNEDDYPVTPGEPEDVPANAEYPYNPSERFKHICTEYMKIVDGVVFQPGEWNDYHKDGVAKEFRPDISKRGVVRLWITEDTRYDTYVLLHGFFMKNVIKGTTGFDDCMDTESPQNGDFLGPMSYPWAVKISFLVSNDINGILNLAAYKRKFPSTQEEAIVVDNKFIVDFNTTDPATYYDDYYESSKVENDVEDFNVSVDSGANVIAYYQRDPRFNGALYGAKVLEAGLQYMYPLDTAAPGQMRVYTDEDLAKDYPTTIPNVYGIYRNEDNHIFLYGEDGDKIDLSNDIGVETNPDHPDSVMATVTSGDNIIKTISLTDEVDGTLFETDGNGNVPINSEDLLNWTRLLKGLSTNRSLEVVGPKLKKYRDNIEMITDAEGNDVNTGSKNNYIEFSTKLTPTTNQKKAPDGTPMVDEDGNPIYASISSGKRLYISSTAPTGNIPEGSLGIGW